MRVTIGQLKKIINEEVSNLTETSKKTSVKVQQLISDINAAADDYARAVKMRSDSPRKHADRIGETADQLVSVAKWLIKHRDPQAERVGRVAKVALELKRISGFWQRPAIIGREAYADKLDGLINDLKRFSRDARVAARSRAA